MATKAQLKQRCKELEDLYLREVQVNEGLAADIATQASVIESLTAEADKYRAYWKHSEDVIAAWVKLANGLIRDIALDIVLERTHRERNDAYRWLVGRIKRALEGIRLETSEEMDDIPF